jgi:hypothetical protein
MDQVNRIRNLSQEDDWCFREKASGRALLCGKKDEQSERRQDKKGESASRNCSDKNERNSDNIGYKRKSVKSVVNGPAKQASRSEFASHSQHSRHTLYAKSGNVPQRKCRVEDKE